MMLFLNIQKKLKFLLAIVLTVIVVTFIINSSSIVLKASYPLKYKEYVYKYASKYNIEPNIVFAVIRAESSFNPKAISHKNARGLMQISEITAKWAASTLKIDNFSYDMLYDPDINIYIGCWYLDNLKKEFGDDLGLILAAYNAGSGNVTEWLRDKEYSKTGNTLDKIPFKETENYVKRVKNNFSVYDRLYKNKN